MAREMKINPFQHHEQALRLRELRTEVLSSNIANADTPGYKARDIDFSREFAAALGGTETLRQTRGKHQGAMPLSPQGVKQMYRVPMQPALDGNTVESDVEQAAFAENVVRYRASLSFLDGQIKGLRYAIKGGD